MGARLGKVSIGQQCKVAVGFVLLAALTLLAITASLASAQSAPNAGSGTGTGTEYLVEGGDYPSFLPGPTCRGADYSEYVVTVVGEFKGTDSSGDTVTYTGPAEVTFTHGTEGDGNDHYYFGPQGTHDSQPCSQSNYGQFAPIETVVSVTTLTRHPLYQGGTISCGEFTTSTGRGYYREGQRFHVDWQGNCDITDSNSGVLGDTGSSTQHVFEGNLNPCAPIVPGVLGACDDPLNTGNSYADHQLQGVWTYQNLN